MPNANAPLIIPPDPATAALRRREYNRMREFQRAVEPFLPTPLSTHITSEQPVQKGFGR
jgi:hypothetical protein